MMGTWWKCSLWCGWPVYYHTVEEHHLLLWVDQDAGSWVVSGSEEIAAHSMLSFTAL